MSIRERWVALADGPRTIRRLGDSGNRSGASGPSTGANTPDVGTTRSLAAAVIAWRVIIERWKPEMMLSGAPCSKVKTDAIP
jgi:hypothetical protein